MMITKPEKPQANVKLLNKLLNTKISKLSSFHSAPSRAPTTSICQDDLIDSFPLFPETIQRPFQSKSEYHRSGSLTQGHSSNLRFSSFGSTSVKQILSQQLSSRSDLGVKKTSMMRKKSSLQPMFLFGFRYSQHKIIPLSDKIAQDDEEQQNHYRKFLDKRKTFANLHMRALSDRVTQKINQLDKIERKHKLNMEKIHNNQKLSIKEIGGKISFPGPSVKQLFLQTVYSEDGKQLFEIKKTKKAQEEITKSIIGSVYYRRIEDPLYEQHH